MTTRRVALAISVALACTSLVACAGSPRPGRPRTLAAGDWPGYGHDAEHTFHGETALTPASARRLKPAWTFHTGDAVTATPTVVGGTVYAGSWDEDFYAVDLRTGKLVWKRHLDPQHGISPYPGESHRDTGTDGGLVTSSAWYVPGTGTRPDLVVFGGGYTLYALDAHNGRTFWAHEYTGRPDLPAQPDTDATRIFSSPVVVGDKVLFGVDVDGEADHRGYVVAASLATGAPVWEYQTDADAHGRLLNDGCGSVWSSGTVLAGIGLVVFGTADCHGANPPPTSEAVLALRIADGSLAWTFRPDRIDPLCDEDFGASANAGVVGGEAAFLGVGSKDGTYYSLDPSNGALRWSRNVVFGGFSGGFIGTTAYDGHAVYGSTAIGDFGRFQGATLNSIRCQPGDPRDTPMQEPSVHAFDAASGGVLWQQSGAASFGATTVAGGMTFNGLALNGDAVQVRDARSGALLRELQFPSACWSGIATVGDAVVFGLGSSFQADSDGIVAATPDGRAPIPSAG
ncbi:MAG: PQQ-binding-like beta-propeller repeat protein [Acidimicrobiia bacterium]|nr:PQQ-binding-like beta-propeller repeat protein [Acidimicrobiia bacterium]